MTPAHIEALQRACAAPHQAAPVARSIGRAEEDGISPVGLGYLPTYLAHLRSGKVRGAARPVVWRVSGDAVAFDPHLGCGRAVGAYRGSGGCGVGWLGRGVRPVAQ